MIYTYELSSWPIDAKDVFPGLNICNTPLVFRLSVIKVVSKFIAVPLNENVFISVPLVNYKDLLAAIIKPALKTILPFEGDKYNEVLPSLKYRFLFVPSLYPAVLTKSPELGVIVKN